MNESNQTRRRFIKACATTPLVLQGLKAADGVTDRFTLGIQEYTFHRWLGSGKLTHLDYPKFCKDTFGITNIEYWSGPFNGHHTDEKHLSELKKRSVGEGLKNILILVDMRPRLDSPSKDERQKSIDEHMPWVDAAISLECEAIRVNCYSGGTAEENLKTAADGLKGLCEKSKESGIKILVENHGGNSANGAWVAELMRAVDLKNCGTLPDFGNFKGNDPYKGLEAMIPWAHTLCAKSHAFDDNGNEKGVDYFRMMKIAAASNFNGVVSIEFEGGGNSPVDGVNKTRSLLLKAIAQAG